MIRLLPFCLPAAAVIGAGAYVASDRAVLRQIGLEPVGRGLAQIRQHIPRALGGKPAIRQGGPECFDVVLWPADGGPLLPIGALPYVAQGYGAGIPMAVSGLGYSLAGGDLASPGVPILPPGSEALVVSTVPMQAQPVTVPEPTSLAIFATALGLMAAVRRFA